MPPAPLTIWPALVPEQLTDRGVKKAVADFTATFKAAGGGRPLRFVPTRNAAGSPYRYEIDSGELFTVTFEADANDEEVWGIVHSHTHTPAQPSPTDISLAFYPDALYVLVSLGASEADAGTGEPGIRAWRIVAGEVFEVALIG